MIIYDVEKCAEYLRFFFFFFILLLKTAYLMKWYCGVQLDVYKKSSNDDEMKIDDVLLLNHHVLVAQFLQFA